jgi:hypothetical protein
MYAYAARYAVRAVGKITFMATSSPSNVVVVAVAVAGTTYFLMTFPLPSLAKLYTVGNTPPPKKMG